MKLLHFQFAAPYLSALFILCLIGCQGSREVQPVEITEKSNPKVIIEKSAAIIGGLAALQQELNYPSKAKKEGIETTLEANVLVNKTGKIEQISFETETEYRFEEAAKNALYSVRFKPGEKNGEPINMFITIPVKFEL